MAKELLGVICRHGDTTLNEENAFRSRIDPPLNDKGESQAEQITRVIKKKYPLYKITSSPMLRAIQTADIIGEAMNVKVKQDRGLLPWALGFLGGRDREKYQHLLDYYVDNPKQEIPDGESLDDFEERIKEFFDDALKSNYHDHELGTNRSGYSDEGPFHCADCIHKTAPDRPYCTHPKVLSDPELKDRVIKVGGRKVVQIDLQRGCCGYVKPKEDSDRKVQCFVCHTSNIVALQNLFQGNRDGRPETGDEAVGTGGLAEIWLKDDGDYELVPVLEEQDAAFGE